MRADRESDIVKLKIRMANDYTSGVRIPEITEKYKDEYRKIYADAEMPRELTNAIVARQIPAYCSRESINKVNDSLTKEIEQMRKKGMIYSEIGKALGISETKARRLYIDYEPKVMSPREEPHPVTRSDVEELLKTLKEGDIVKTMVEHNYQDLRGNNRTRLVKENVKILHMSTFGAQTDKGFLRYSDMVIYMRMVK